MSCEQETRIAANRCRFANIGRLLTGMLGLLLCLVLSSSARGQRLDGGLRVEVGDSSGAAILDAKVTVTNEATNVSVSTDTSSSGTYVFPNLLVGTYTITVEKAGFKKAVQKGVGVTSNQVTEAKIALELGEVSAVVEVAAGAELIKTESSTLETTFSGRVVSDLPVASLGGDVKEFAVMAPGTTTQQGGVLGSGGSIGGTRPRFNGFSIDGVDDNKLDTNGPTQPVIQESVAEFTLLTNQFSAENGHSAGGQFVIVTKSGTNDWRGSGWLFNRNRNYNAADNLQKQRIQSGQATDKDRFDYNRAGASVGGPILKNKLFVFGAYEFQNNGLASSSPSFDSPTAAGLTTLNSLAADNAVRDILAEFPVAPVSTRNITVNGQTIPVGTIQSVAPNFANQHDFNVNTDLNLAKHQFRGRFLYDRFRAPDFNPSQPQAQFLGTNSSDARKIIITDAWTITNRLINDFRASYSRLNGPNLVVPSAFTNFPNVEIDELGSNLGPNGLAPQGYAQNVYQAVDSISYIRGRHTFKGGAEFRKYISPTNGLPRARGEWDYGSLSSFINDFVPDGANGALRGAGSGSVASNYNAFYWFFQDDWKVTSRLTLNLGLRYEFDGVAKAEGQQALNSISDDPAFGLIFRKPKSDKNNFAPRVGFAWDPTGHGKWSIRGGGGFAYDVIPNNFAINSLPPQLQTEQNPNLTCGLSNRPAWCTSFLDPNDGTGAGFLAGGGLLQVNLPPTTQLEARAGTQSLIPDHVQPKVITWTLGVQHALLRDSSIEVRYVGTRSLLLPVQQRLNSASAFDPSFPGGGLTPLPTYINPSDVPAVVASPATTLANFDNFNPQRLSVDGFLGNVTTFPSSGNGIYHGASVDFIHRFTRGLYFRTNYTFAKNIDNSTNELFSSRVNPRRAQDGFNFADERGPSALDIRHKLAITWVYEVPNIHTENGFLRTVAHGWQWSGTYLAESGQPVTPLSGVDSNFNGDAAGDRTIINPSGIGLTGSTVTAVCNNSLAGGGITYIDATCDPNHADDNNAGGDPTPGSDAAVVGYLADNSSARFIQAGPGAKATAGRNTVYSPGLNIWNMSVFKTTKINERFSVQFRAETYNTFNHRNFSIGLPTNNGTIDQTQNANPLSAGYIFVSTGNLFLNARQFNGGSRTMQLGLKLTW